MHVTFSVALPSVYTFWPTSRDPASSLGVQLDFRDTKVTPSIWLLRLRNLSNVPLVFY